MDYLDLCEGSVNKTLTMKVDTMGNFDLLLPIVSSLVVLKIQNKNKFLDTNLTIYLCKALEHVDNDPYEEWISRVDDKGVYMPMEYNYPLLRKKVTDPFF